MNLKLIFCRSATVFFIWHGCAPSELYWVVPCALNQKEQCAWKKYHRKWVAWNNHKAWAVFCLNQQFTAHGLATARLKKNTQFILLPVGASYCKWCINHQSSEMAVHTSYSPDTSAILKSQWLLTHNGLGSMHDIFAYIHHKSQLCINVGIIYQSHGFYR